MAVNDLYLKICRRSLVFFLLNELRVPLIATIVGIFLAFVEETAYFSAETLT